VLRATPSSEQRAASSEQPPAGEPGEPGSWYYRAGSWLVAEHLLATRPS
jgi:hypothetical protein